MRIYPYEITASGPGFIYMPALNIAGIKYEWGFADNFRSMNVSEQPHIHITCPQIVYCTGRIWGMFFFCAYICMEQADRENVIFFSLELQREVSLYISYLVTYSIDCANYAAVFFDRNRFYFIAGKQVYILWKSY